MGGRATLYTKWRNIFIPGKAAAGGQSRLRAAVPPEGAFEGPRPQEGKWGTRVSYQPGSLVHPLIQPPQQPERGVTVPTRHTLPGGHRWAL